MKKALIFQGGWQGHEPKLVAEILGDILQGEQFEVTLTDTLETLEQEDLRTYDLIVPNWTQGVIKRSQLNAILEAVAEGTGLAGLHGGMADAFRTETDYQFMVGGQWVAHPGNDGVTYTVKILDEDHPLTKGMKDFQVTSEQYYLHVDPAVKVLATTRFTNPEGPYAANGEVEMPVVWTKKWGKGRVYYCSLGHVAEVVNRPEVKQLMRNGMVWAAR